MTLFLHFCQNKNEYKLNANVYVPKNGTCLKYYSKNKALYSDVKQKNEEL